MSLSIPSEVKLYPDPAQAAVKAGDEAVFRVWAICRDVVAQQGTGGWIATDDVLAILAAIGLSRTSWYHLLDNPAFPIYFSVDPKSPRIFLTGLEGVCVHYSVTPHTRPVYVPLAQFHRLRTPGNRNFSLYPQPDSFGCFYQPAAVGLQTFGNLDAQPIFYYGKNATKKNMGVRCSFQMTSQADDVAHPCRKPTKEWQQLILAHTLPGQTVLDPFMGSGTTGEICIKNDRKFIGVELDVAYFQLAKQRIEKAAQMAAGEFVTKAGSVADTDDLPLFGT